MKKDYTSIYYLIRQIDRDRTKKKIDSIINLHRVIYDCCFCIGRTV